MIDKEKLAAELLRRYGKKTADEIMSASSKPRKGTTTITTAMK